MCWKHRHKKSAHSRCMCRDDLPNILDTSVVLPSLSSEINKITMNLPYDMIRVSWFRNKTDTEVQFHDLHNWDMGFYWRNWRESCLWKCSPFSAMRKKNTFSKPKNKKKYFKKCNFFECCRFFTHSSSSWTWWKRCFSLMWTTKPPVMWASNVCLCNVAYLQRSDFVIDICRIFGCEVNRVPTPPVPSRVRFVGSFAQVFSGKSRK